MHLRSLKRAQSHLGRSVKQAVSEAGGSDRRAIGGPTLIGAASWSGQTIPVTQLRPGALACAPPATYLESLVAGDDVGGAVLEFVQVELAVAVHREYVARAPRQVQPQAEPVQQRLQRADVPARLEPAKASCVSLGGFSIWA